MMDATQVIEDFEEEFYDSHDEEETKPVAKLKVFKNQHVPEAEFLLYPGENILGRDAAFCTVPLPAPSMSKRHATVSISVFRSHRQHANEATEALIWDMGSLNGTRKGRLKLKPHVRYALSEGDKMTLADVPCQYVSVGTAEGQNSEGKVGPANCLVRERGEETSSPYIESCEGNLRTEKGIEADRVERPGGGKRGFLTPSSKQSDANPRGIQEMSAKAPVAEQNHQIPSPLLPESDSETDGEREGWRLRAAKCLDSPSIAQPSCSTFQSPSGPFYIPESPSSSVKGRLNETVSSGESIQTDRSTEAAPKKPRPDPLEFNMDSDTDVEEEEDNGQRKNSPEAKEEPSAKLVVGMPAGHATKPPDFHMDSDTDAEGDDHEMSATHSTKPSLGEISEKPPNPTAAAQPDFHLESDTDVEDEDEVPKTVALAELHMDSDTDIEEGSSDQTGVSQADASAPRLTTFPVKPEECQSHSNFDSVETAADNMFKSGNRRNTEACTSRQPKPLTAVEIQSDGDTDVEVEGERQLAGLQSAPEMASRVVESDHDTDLEEEPTSSAGGKQKVAPAAVTTANPDEFNMDSNTDLETELKEDISPRKARERDSTAGIQSSTPMGAGLQLEEMETQLFISPSDRFARLRDSPPFNPVVTSEHSEDDDFVPETPSFVTEPEPHGAARVSALNETALEETQLFDTGSQRKRSTWLQLEEMETQLFISPSDHFAPPSTQLQLSLSDSSCLQQPASESTVACNLPQVKDSDDEGDFELDATQDYGALQATQAYTQEPVKDKEEAHVDSATGKPQAFFSTTGRGCRSGDGSAEALPPALSDGLQKLEGPGTQLRESEIYSHISTADTVILHQSQRLVGEASADLVANTTISETKQGNLPATKFYMDSDTDVDEEKDDSLKEVQAEANSPQPTTTALHTTASCAETEHMSSIDDSGEEEEEPEVVPAKRKGRARRGHKHDSQPSEALLIAETQPVTMNDDDDDDDNEDEALKPASPERHRRRRKHLRDESEPSEAAHSSCLSATKTQLMASVAEEEKSKPASPRRKGRMRRRRGAHVEDETEPSETLLNACLSVFEEEESKPAEMPLSTCLSTAETQPMATYDEEEEEEDDMQPAPSTSRVKTHRAGEKPVVARSTRGRGNAEEERQGEELDGRMSVKPKRQTKGKTPAVKKGGQRREEVVGEKKEDAEEKPVQEVRRGRGRKSVVQQGEEQEERERLEKERIERVQKEQGEKLEREEKERQEREMLEMERLKKESKEKAEREKKEKEKERLEKESKERAEREKKEKDEKERLEKEKEERQSIEREKREKEERDRKEWEEKERVVRERLEKEKEERETLEREEREKELRVRKQVEEEEKERLAQEKQEKKERERLEREKQQKEERERKAEERKRLKKGKLEKETKEKEEKEKIDMGRREEEEKKRKQAEEREWTKKKDEEKTKEEREQEKKENNDRLPKETQNKEQTKVEKEESDVKPQASTRGRRAATRRAAPVPPSGLEEPVLASADCPARRTRSHSTSSERSTSSVCSSGSRQGAPEPHSSRRASRALSTFSNSECSEVGNVASKEHWRGRKSVRAKDPESEAEPQAEKPSATKPLGRGRRGRRTGARDEAADSGSTQAKGEDKLAEEDVGPSPTGRRGAREAKVHLGATVEGSQVAAVLEGSSDKQTDSRGRTRGKKSDPPSQTTSAEDESADVSVAATQGRGKKRSQNEESEPEKTETEDSVGVEEPEKNDEAVAPGSAQKKRRGRQSVSQIKKEVKKEVEESKEAVTASTSSSMEPENEAQFEETSEKRSRKRGAAGTQVSTPAKSARRSVGPLRQAHKVLFTGVMDDLGEAVVVRLGGSMAKGVNDMTHLVTDAVRRTVKFMCAMARGVPIVTPDWLKKCGKAGSFLSADEFLVEDREQEKKFNFSLKESLRIASSQPLLQGYEIHVTRSVKPEPAQMKDIIICCGARYLPKMPSVNKPQTVVVSCSEDAALCSVAVAASVPVVTSEFLLTGILQQQADVVAHALTIAQAPIRGRRNT